LITRAQKIRLGVFLLVSFLLLLALVAAVVGSAVFADRDRYRIQYDISVSGLEVGAPVKYNGVRVGRVERIWIDPEQVSQTVVAISLQQGTPIKENTRAVLNVQGITGLRFIELVGGTSDAKTLPPGASIKAGTSVVDKLTGQAEQLSLKAEKLINQMLSLTGEENQALLGDVLERAGSLMHTLDETVQQNRHKIGETIDNLNRSAHKLNAALDEIRLAAAATREAVGRIRRAAERVLDHERVAGLLDTARAALNDVRTRVGKEELGRALASVGRLLRRTDALVEKLDLVVAASRQDLRITLRYLAETTENLRDFSRLIREDPSRLLSSPKRQGRDLP
jgi:phospholipid/cholesterol/gamma-HCH transport system substrate-binding protein